jgi:hypothetical protein
MASKPVMSPLGRMLVLMVSAQEIPHPAALKMSARKAKILIAILLTSSHSPAGDPEGGA